MKKSLALFLAVVLCVSFLLSVPVSAALTVRGDIDGDGVASTKDARLVLQFAAGQKNPSPAQRLASDLDLDGDITTEDARLTLIAASGIDSDESYMAMLQSKGFPKSYVEDLLYLHRKYPQWEFEPMITNLEWSEAVKGEHTPHNKQVIDRNAPDDFKCSCSKCNGVIQEKPCWVSASENAVKYYLDPRNFLDEEHIFQFESVLYSKVHTQKGVESILKPTWMYDNYITYLDTLGKTKTYKYKNGTTPKYSDVIMSASKDSGMSAYYLAAKMVQEVGSKSPSNAGGSSGKNEPYNGIYNYYNIGAYTGAGDGLRWANGYMKAKSGAVAYEKASTTSKALVKIPADTELNYISASGDFYRVKVKVSNKWYMGYVPKRNVQITTTWGRPWDNPYKCIINGANYIYNSFAKTQYTSFLQKFNVNPESENLYGHEYMGNIQAAASEAEHTYRAYKDNNLLNNAKVFSIPVFKNMPYGDLTKEERFKKSKVTVGYDGYTETTLTLSWSKLPYADGYNVYKYNTSSKKYEKIGSTTNLSFKVDSLKINSVISFKVLAYKEVSVGKRIYSSYSDVFYGATAPEAPKGLSLVSVSETQVKIKWNKTPNGEYRVYRREGTGDYIYLDTLKNVTTFTDTDVLGGTEYSYNVRNINRSESMAPRSEPSNILSVKTKGEAPVNEGIVKVDDWLNVRSGPSTNDKVIAQLKNGTKVLVLGTSGDFLKIRFTYNGKTQVGYAHKDYITQRPIKEKCPYKEPLDLLKSGSSGDGVRWVQWHLYKLKYLEKSDIDGDFGPTTLNAVKRFQGDKKLDVDGIVGSGTRTELKKAYEA